MFQQVTIVATQWNRDFKAPEFVEEFPGSFVDVDDISMLSPTRIIYSIHPADVRETGHILLKNGTSVFVTGDSIKPIVEAKGGTTYERDYLR